MFLDEMKVLLHVNSTDELAHEDDGGSDDGPVPSKRREGSDMERIFFSDVGGGGSNYTFS